MPDRDVHTVKDVIFFQYSKLITRAVFNLSNGTEAKKKCYGFVKKTFKDLQTGEKVQSEITREDRQFVSSENNSLKIFFKLILNFVFRFLLLFAFFVNFFAI